MTDNVLKDIIPSAKNEEDVDMAVGINPESMELEQQQHQQDERLPPRLMITKMVCVEILFCVFVFLFTLDTISTMFQLKVCMDSSTSGSREFQILCWSQRDWSLSQVFFCCRWTQRVWKIERH
jgi:hypothetical protein